MKQIDDPRLLPCPFCGEDAAIWYYPASERLNCKDSYYVGCTNDNCGCEMEHLGGWKTHEEAVEAWNRRHKALEQEPFKPMVEIDLDYVIKQKYIEREVLDKIRAQIKSNLRGVEIALEVLVENHPLRPKMEGAKDTLEECLELIDKAETEGEECITTKL